MSWYLPNCWEISTTQSGKISWRVRSSFLTCRSESSNLLFVVRFFFNCNLYCLFSSIQTSFRPRTPPFLRPFLFLLLQLSNETLFVSAISLPWPSNFIFQLFTIVLGCVQFRKSLRIWFNEPTLETLYFPLPNAVQFVYGTCPYIRKSREVFILHWLKQIIYITSRRMLHIPLAYPVEKYHTVWRTTQIYSTAFLYIRK